MSHIIYRLTLDMEGNCSISVIDRNFCLTFTPLSGSYTQTMLSRTMLEVLICYEVDLI